MSSINSYSAVYGSSLLNTNNQIKTAATDFAAEANDLVKEGLIGEDSLIGFGAQSGSISYWSNQSHAQWKAYNQEGSDAALQAAEYHKQMIAERQDIANQYLSQVTSLATEFNDLSMDKISFHQVLDNAQAGNSLTHGLDHLSESDVKKIEQFWQDQTANLNRLDNSLTRLQSFPKDLDNWLQHQDEPISDEVFQIVDQLKNSWVNIESTGPEKDYQARSFDLQIEEGASTPNTVAISESDKGSSLLQSLEQVALKNAQIDYTSFGFKDNLLEYAGKEFLQHDLRQTYAEMQILSKDLYSEFSDLFGKSSGNSPYSLQDMIDNHLENKPLAQLEDGSIHPQELAIQEFWKENELALEQYSAKQQKLNDQPDNFGAYQSQNKSKINQYFMDNLDRFLNMKLS
ncbi:hypothetical protein ACMXYX_10110 [Neptuniibacter sp. QD72_48]|uniref:hypothetical protein n=1 Tax=unclassified Neptuniibacter TaxID=2630693 RepID=UPI0039F51234